ncbi:MAG: DUF72 domain-containing protein [Bacteroidota bacterium]|nr:DUF72 domain-containing protein [Bacteroidota bacterium]
MKFGSVSSVKGIDLSLPKDHPDTLLQLGGKESKKISISIGCAKWNKTDLKNFYPKGIKDELEYYSTQFNSIELNATFYQKYTPEQYKRWKDKTPKGFKFFPKINGIVSHSKRLNNVKSQVEEFCNAAVHLEEKLGMVFLQMRDDFKPKDYDRLETFVKDFPKGIPLAIELRSTEWFGTKKESDRVYALFKKYKVTNVIVDTAGRRDIMHMRLSTSKAFIRYVGANDKSDYSRLDPWVERIAKWKKNGLKELGFFLHQNEEKESPLLAAYFTEKLNKKLGMNLHISVKPPVVIPKKKTPVKNSKNKVKRSLKKTKQS